MAPIVGNRYKCTICNDFDYCEACEEINSDSHKHPFLKIRKPEDAPIKIICAIREDFPEFNQPQKVDEIKLNQDPEINKPNAEIPVHIPEVFSDSDIRCPYSNPNLCEQNEPQEKQNSKEGFFNKVKNTFNEIPNKLMLVEDLIRNKFKDVVRQEDEETKRYRQMIPLIRQNFLLENVTDDQLLNSLIKTKGDVDQAICLLFSD
jgi:hypothetical protein